MPETIADLVFWIMAAIMVPVLVGALWLFIRGNRQTHSDHEKRISAIGKALDQHKLHTAETYVKRETHDKAIDNVSNQIQRLADKIERGLEKIFAKLEEKADKR